MLSFADVLKIKEEYKTTEEYRNNAYGMSIVPVRYLNAVYNLSLPREDELCFFVYRKGAEGGLRDFYKEVRIFGTVFK